MRVVCADNPNVEVYEKQRDNGGLPSKDEANPKAGVRIQKL